MTKPKFTPQVGVRRGPYSLFGLRKALQKLQQFGHGRSRADGFSILVQRIEKEM